MQPCYCVLLNWKEEGKLSKDDTVKLVIVTSNIGLPKAEELGMKTVSTAVMTVWY